MIKFPQFPFLQFPQFWLARGWQAKLLLPFSWLYLWLFRQARNKQLRQGVYQPPIPVIVVGNIVLGGTGKTPMVIHLAKLLTAQGYQVGIISKGYGSKFQQNHQKNNQKSQAIKTVQPSDTAIEVGDEPLLMLHELANESKAIAVVLCKSRVKGIEHLHQLGTVDVIISDDGLQDYRFKHTIEVVMQDGNRGVGNGYCLPAGPLREPASKLAEADFVVSTVNSSAPTDSPTDSANKNNHPIADNSQGYQMQLQGNQATNLKTGETCLLADFRQHYPTQTIVAIAGIGNPQRFFDSLKDKIPNLQTQGFSDHHNFQSSDFASDSIDSVILMTSKDAIKCHSFATSNMWVVPVQAELDEVFDYRLIQILNERS